jgi:hypothetical protein
MKHLKIFMLLAFVGAIANAQTGVSGFMKSQGEGSFSFSSAFENYDEVLLVPQAIDGVPVFNEVDVNSYNLFVEYGITDRLTASVNLPYIVSTGNATDAILQETGFENERSGLQDISFNFKYQATEIEFETSRINFIANLGFETPLSDYNVDEGLQSIIAIGNQSTRFNTIGISQFKMDNGFFATGQIGYSVRSEEVPNAILSQLKIGYAGSKFYGDVYIGSQKSESGVDIVGEGFTGFFPATRVSFTRIGTNLYVPLYQGFGLSTGFASIIEGRNIGKATTFFGGINYSF